MNPEHFDMDPTLEQAISAIRAEAPPAEVIEAAAARVWARLAEPVESIRTCADFQTLIPDFRAGRLSEARALLVQDHLHECVACRRVFEGRDRSLTVAARAASPIRAATVRKRFPRWAIAAGVLVTGGLVAWFSIIQFDGNSGRAVVRSINGALYEISLAGVRVMAAGEPLSDGMEIRTSGGSSAMLALGDGSLIEMGARSDFSTSRDSSNATIHLDRGSIIVHAAKRRSGHLYLATPDCRVAVTGTVFGVSAGVKGSRVSVVQGEVHVTQNDGEHVLHPGQQFSSTASLEPVALKDDFGWSRDATLLRQIASLRENFPPFHAPDVRYSSRLLGLLPASTAFFASIPNLAQYLADAQSVFRRKSEENSDLRAWLAGPGAAILPVIEKLRSANEYLGDEIAIFGTPNSTGPVFLAEAKRDGFAEFLSKAGIPLAVETRGNLVLFGPNRDALQIALDSGFQRTPFYSRIAAAYRRGAGLLLCADLAHMPPPPVPPGFPSVPPHPAPRSLRYLIAEQRAIGQSVETRAAISFENPRAGIAGWLGAPSPMGALDYISPEATFVLAFTLSKPAAILDELPPLFQGQESSAARKDAASALGGEFALAMDGPVLPVPSWKIVAEVYDAARFEEAVEKAAEAHDLRMTQESYDGHTLYAIRTSNPNALTEAHYTFTSGYLIATPTRALLLHALEARANGTGIARAPAFLAMLPRDHYTNASALLYQNFGTTLTPFAALLGPKAPPTLSNFKPTLIAAYAEPDRIALASRGDLLGTSLNNFVSGSVFNLANNLAPLGQALGTIGGMFSSR
jgi:ferric-dicitrate binding protein FerR (iron transport regulator)